MNRFMTSFGLLVLVGLTALLIGTVGRMNRHQTVNAVLGDESFVATFGHAPGIQTPEAVRIRTHLTYVERLLRQRSVGSLSPQLRSRRAKLLDHLRAYIQAGHFPSNYDYPGERRPCFIDRTGAVCAVGYLVEQSAGRALANLINARHQYDLIADMHLPELNQWVAQSGLTPNECAMIQPSYSYPGPPIYQNSKQVSTGYAFSSGVLNAANITLGVLNGQQLNVAKGSSIVPWLGLAGGLSSMALGVANRPRGYEFQGITSQEKDPQPAPCICTYQTNELYTRHSVRDAISWTNIGVGAASTALSAWNLLRGRKALSGRAVPRTRYSLAPQPGSGAVVQVARTF